MRDNQLGLLSRDRNLELVQNAADQLLPGNQFEGATLNIAHVLS